MQALGDWRKSLNWRTSQLVHPTVTIASLASHMRSRVGSQVQRGRCAGRASRRRAAALPIKGATRHQCGVQVRQAPPFNGSSRPALPPPSCEGGSAGEEHSIRFYFRVERGVDFRNFQPLQRSRRLNRTFRWHASRPTGRFARVAAVAMPSDVACGSYAALSADGAMWPSSLTSSNRTETRFDTPDSCIVTPYRVSEQVIVRLE